MNLPLIGIFTPVCLHLSVKCTKLKSDKFLYARLIKLPYEIENLFFFMSGVTTVTHTYIFHQSLLFSVSVLMVLYFDCLFSL